MKKNIRFAVVGGDMRQAKLAELLAEDGHEVCAAALESAELKPSVRCFPEPAAAIRDADCVILPLPVTGKPCFLNAPLTTEPPPLTEVFAALSPSQTVCAGLLDDACRLLAAKRGLHIFDYFAREELAIANAVCTAEGAIALAMDNTSITLGGANILVVGFGRIGKALSHRLRALGARVSVSARTHADRAWITAYGCEALDTGALDGRLGGFDVIFNTVPARVLGASRLSELPESCLCIDLASKPGGVDFPAAARLGVRAVWALSLPGESAPVTSGAIIRDTIYNILHEEEES